MPVPVTSEPMGEASRRVISPVGSCACVRCGGGGGGAGKHGGGGGTGRQARAWVGGLGRWVSGIVGSWGVIGGGRGECR